MQSDDTIKSEYDANRLMKATKDWTLVEGDETDDYFTYNRKRTDAVKRRNLSSNRPLSQVSKQSDERRKARACNQHAL